MSQYVKVGVTKSVKIVELKRPKTMAMASGRHSAPLSDVSSNFAMEQVKYTTEVPV